MPTIIGKTCSECQTENDKDANFCKNCAADLKEAKNIIYNEGLHQQK